ncbi:MAG: hypothetical protein ACOC1K_02345 [Nanoarchaeota archaeon]
MEFENSNLFELNKRELSDKIDELHSIWILLRDELEVLKRQKIRLDRKRRVKPAVYEECLDSLKSKESQANLINEYKKIVLDVYNNIKTKETSLTSMVEKELTKMSLNSEIIKKAAIISNNKYPSKLQAVKDLVKSSKIPLSLREAKDIMDISFDVISKYKEENQG